MTQKSIDSGRHTSWIRGSRDACRISTNNRWFSRSLTDNTANDSRRSTSLSNKRLTRIHRDGVTGTNCTGVLLGKSGQNIDSLTHIDVCSSSSTTVE